MIPDRIQSDFLDSSACRGHGASSRDWLPSGEGTSYVPLGRGPAGAEALSPEGRKLAQRAAQRLDRRSWSGGFRRKVSVGRSVAKPIGIRSLTDPNYMQPHTRLGTEDEPIR